MFMDWCYTDAILISVYFQYVLIYNIMSLLCMYKLNPQHKSFFPLINMSSYRGFVQLGCLFFPKVHVVLFKPEKNTRDAVMSPTRHSSCRGDSVYRKQGQEHHSAPPVFVLNGGLRLVSWWIDELTLTWETWSRLRVTGYSNNTSPIHKHS